MSPSVNGVIVLWRCNMLCGILISHWGSTGLLSHHQHHLERPQRRRCHLGQVVKAGITPVSAWQVQDSGKLHTPGREAGFHSLNLMRSTWRPLQQLKEREPNNI